MKTPEEIKKGLECCSVAACGFCPYEYPCNLENGFTEVSNDALAYIQQLEHHIGELTEKVAQLEAAQPKWISVEEKLPEFGRYLVITKKDNDVGTVNTATYSDMGWWVLANFGEIIHWMPIPEPPKEDCNE